MLRLSFFVCVVLLVSTACVDTKKSVRIKGSDTEVNLTVLLAENFHNERPDLLVSVSGGGSGLGIASLLNGTTDLANSSREMKSAERLLFEQKHHKIGEFIFAQDAIAFIVAQTCPLDSLDTETLAGFLSGKLDNWNAIGWKKLKVNVYGRQSNSGTYDYVKKKLEITFTPHAKQMNGNAQILEGVREDQSGIGYVSAGYLLGGNAHGVKIMKIYEKNKKAVSPMDAQAIAHGIYYFQRPLFQYYLLTSYQKVKPFLEFEKSGEGRKIIRSAGYYPVYP